MPNPLRVFVNLPHAVKGNSMDRSFAVNYLERLRAVFGKRDFRQRYENDAVLRAIVVTQLEITFGKLRIPSDAA